MRRPVQRLFRFCSAAATAVAISAASGEAPDYRTDENNALDLPWFQPVGGEFPPEGSAHYISGELVGSDHLEREVVLRVDRSDSQTADMKDHPISATMLPYGTAFYHGQPGSLRDIPTGTHLHGWFFERPGDEPKVWTIKNGNPHNNAGKRVSNEIDFTRCLRLEDDFTYHARRGEIWKIGAVDLEKMELVATLQDDGNPVGDARQFDLVTSTVVFEGDGFGTLASIKPGQEVLMNLTWATLYSSGRVVEAWIDEESRKLASARQLERHRNHVRERGIPGWVDAVDDEKQVVTVTFFDGIDPTLFADFDTIVPEPLGWPTSGGAKDDLAPKGTLAVARDCLMTFDPVNDRKGGNILAVEKVPVRPGSSGVQIQVQCGMLLEGFRPGKVVRFFPASWPVVALPREEQYFGRE